MKTFSEAVSKTMMRKVKGAELPVTNIRMTDEAPSCSAEIGEAQNRYGEILKEIQNSEESAAFAVGLASSIPDGFTIEDLIIIAFSHGVMVGIEMEKPD